MRLKKNAKFNFENGDNDLAMFHIEQACQLMIKAKLLDKKGYFERTHSLRKLLSEVFKEEVEEAFEVLEELGENGRIFHKFQKYAVNIKSILREYLSDFEVYVFGSVVRGDYSPGLSEYRFGCNFR